MNNDAWRDYIVGIENNFDNYSGFVCPVLFKSGYIFFKSGYEAGGEAYSCHAEVL